MEFKPLGLCPLCDYYDHEGKCQKFSGSAWWCGPCLVSKLRPEELDGPRLPNDLLLDVGIGRATKFCLWCSVPVCSEHLGPKGHCAHTDCRVLSPPRQKELVLALDQYVPTWRTDGPPRCESCNLPVYRYSVCRRHFDQLKSGRRRLHPGRLRRVLREPAVHLVANITKTKLETVRRIVEVEGGTLSSYVEDLITADIRRRVNEVRAKANLRPK